MDLAPYTGCLDCFTLEPRRPSPVGGIDREQLFNAVVYCEATAPFLYGRFEELPPTVHYRGGSRPVLERIAEQVITVDMSGTQRASALGRWVYEHVPHILLHDGALTPQARGWSEEALIEDGRAWCNEQVRIFACLCQVVNIPARMVAIHHVNRRAGHVVAEFWSGRNWAMFDVTYDVAARLDHGRCASAAEIRDHPGAARAANRAYEPAVAVFQARVPDCRRDRYYPMAFEFDRSPAAEKFAGIQIWDYPIAGDTNSPPPVD